jgi:hypothetical protein
MQSGLSFNRSSARQAKIVIASARDSLLKARVMTPRGSAVFGVTAKSVSGLALAFLVLATFFGFLNIQKIKAVRANAPNASASMKLNAPPGGDGGTNQQAKVTEAENRAEKAETELAQAQKEKADLQAKLDASQQEVASMQKRVEETEKNANASADDLRHQLDSAEKEKVFLSEKLQDSQGQTAQSKEGKKRRETGSTQGDTASPQRAGVRGSVLAYNQVYNFVVLNLGARNGVESNTEMLVLREGTLIGKIRISSVEPTTAIGDIIPSSLARGVQVQPGDTVIYAGTSP